MSTVRLSNIRKSFNDVEVIKGMNLEIADREFAVFVGPSGCGKSTLLRLIAGLEEATEGEIWIDGQRINDVPPDKRGLSMVFQNYALYPHMNVADNMGFSLRLAGIDRKERDRKVREAARILQIEPLLGRKPKELSGGQRQRVAIGRAIVRNPKAFLFDEPLSNLDAALRIQMRLEILGLHEELAATMIYVTHDQVEAMTMADRIVVLHGGIVEQVGSPLELYHHPCNLFVAGFIGSPRMNFIPATVAAGSEAGITVNLGLGAMLQFPGEAGIARPGGPVTVGVRPEHLSLGDDGLFRGEVLLVERLGNVTFLHIRTEGGLMLTVEAESQNQARIHERVGVNLDRDACHLFNEAGNATAPPR